MAMRKTSIRISLAVALLSTSAAASSRAAESDLASSPAAPVADSPENGQIMIEPVFEYPVAPEDIPDLTGKTNYLMEHFWDAMDFKSKTPVDQTALNHAFATYCSSMPYADEKKVIKSVASLASRIKGNTSLTIQMTKAAEEALYGPRADMWIDQLYLPFLEVYLKDKKISESRKLRYAEQYRILKATAVDAKAPDFMIEFADGRKRPFAADKEFTLIEFGDPDCSDCRYAKMKLDISSVINGLIADGRLGVCFIIADDDETGAMMEMVKGYPEKWTVGKSPEVVENYDLRATPAFYVLGPGGKIIAKNVSVDTAIGIIEAAAAQAKPSGKDKKSK